MSEPTAIDRRALEAHVIERAWKDEIFRQELLRDPRGVLQRELAQLRPEGGQLPENVDVQVVEETPTTLYLVLPSRPQTAGTSVELSDADLELVAGGMRRTEPEATWTSYGEDSNCVCNTD